MNTYEKLLEVKDILEITKNKKVDCLRHRVLIKQMLSRCFSDNVLRVAASGQVQLSNKEFALIVKIGKICSGK